MRNPLIHSFCFLDGIGISKENSIWAQGILCWDDFLRTKRIRGISSRRKAYYDCRILDARNSFLDSDSSFLKTFPSSEIWRGYDWFNENACYLDVETGGKNSKHKTSMTALTIHSLKNTSTFISGMNLYVGEVKRIIPSHSLLVTFNGSSFDLPIIKRHFNIDIVIPHLDLKHLCARFGLVGGLKNIEKELGIPRESSSDTDASFLWKMFRSTRNRKYLDLLIQYNREDAVNLELVAEKMFKIASEFFFSHIDSL